MEAYPYMRFGELLYDKLHAEEVQRWLNSVGIMDWRNTHQRLLRMAQDYNIRPTLALVLPYLMVNLEQVANPDAVIIYLERLLNQSSKPQATVEILAENPRAIDILVRLFTSSQFLTEILLHHPEYFTQLVTLPQISVWKSKKQLAEELSLLMENSPDKTPDAQVDYLRQFQRQEFLRIGVCDLLELFDLAAVTAQLAYLADSLVSASLKLAAALTSCTTQGFAVLAMGKLGGAELNYSSDIDLLFVARTNAEAYRTMGEKLIDILTRVTKEGFLYRVDMRLRPWGKSGPLITTHRGFLTYHLSHARLWEKQALLKARVIAGDIAAGNELLEIIEPQLYAMDSAALRTHVFNMKQQTESLLQQRGQAWGEVKLGEGSIRDIEFVIQYLQMVHGRTHPDVRSTNTLDALDRLRSLKFLRPYEYRILREGYVFLRTVEHHLQMMHYHQTHSLPDNPTAMSHLARRLGFSGKDSAQLFMNRYSQHREAVRTLYLHHLRGDVMESINKDLTTHNRAAHITRMDASYTTVFSQDEINMHTHMAALLDSSNLVETHITAREGNTWIITVVAFDYPGELSLICGLLFVHGFSIEQGHVYTYESLEREGMRAGKPERKKIVDTFTVHSVTGRHDPEIWQRYNIELQSLLQLMNDGQPQQARGSLAKRVGAALQVLPEMTTTLYPIEIEIDNQSTENYTELRISSQDTVGFLYEFTNALALNRIYISRMHVHSEGDSVQDVLYVTDARGQKITSPGKIRELRAATVMTKHFTHLLPHTPNPESAMIHFSEFVSQLFRQPNWPDEIASLENPDVLNGLARLLGLSEFLWDDFLRMQHANLFPVVRDVDALDTMKTKTELQAELESDLAHVHPGPQASAQINSWREAINAFKDREMFRIDMRHILGHTKEFDEFSEELTALAEVIVNATFHLCHEDLRAVYGSPLLEDGTISEMSVCALGKFGGRELGFASDIELMFIYSGNGKTSGPTIITTAEFYEKLVQLFVQAIEAKREGVFEIDLRLRPYGKSGSMAVSLEGYKRYFIPGGPAWAFERQALVKLRPVAGNTQLGNEIGTLRDGYIYAGIPFDITAMRAMRERQLRHLVAGGTFNAKYSPGGLVDIEYLVQAMQITHGHKLRTLRQTNIREAMHALADAGLLSEKSYDQLRKAHTFLRWLIDGLRMVRGNAKDLTVPLDDEEALTFLAQRMRYGKDVAKLRGDLTLYTSAVLKL
ncbi:MAG: glutamine synthetase adenylyltransferase, partial [Anaerolineae bacterium]|nr:glutamine synthetase adenylyltransferase [Anaerolineae bacterium]